jgi:hypothetical protein
MNYCTPYPVADGVRDYLYEVLHVEHFTSTPLLVDNQQYSVVKLLVHSLPLACGLKLQRLDMNILLHTPLKIAFSNQLSAVSYRQMVKLFSSLCGGAPPHV